VALADVGDGELGFMVRPDLDEQDEVRAALYALGADEYMEKSFEAVRPDVVLAVTNVTISIDAAKVIDAITRLLIALGAGKTIKLIVVRGAKLIEYKLQVPDRRIDPHRSAGEITDRIAEDLEGDDPGGTLGLPAAE
jgi:hypothetical protein